MKTSQLRNIIREELLKELNEVENTEYGSMYSSPQQQQSEMNKLLKQVEELKQMRDDLDRQIDQLEVIANTFNVNEDAAANQAAMAAKKTAIDKEIVALNKQKQELSKPGTTLEETQLDEMAKISEPIQNAINIATNRLKSQFPDITAGQITNILTSKKKSPEYAPELVKAIDDDEKMYGGDTNYSPGIKGPQTLRAVNKALGEYEPQPRGRKAGEPKAEKPSAEPKAKAEKTSAPKAEKPSTPKTEKPAAAKSATAKTEPADKEDAAATKMAAGVKGGALNKAEKYGKLEKEFNRITAELKSLAKDTSPEAMTKRKALSGDKIRIEQAMAKLKQI